MQNEIIKMIEELSAEELTDVDQDLLSTDVLDSFGIVNLIVMLEEKYGIEIDVEYVTPDNFRSVRNIADLIKKFI